MTKQTHEDFVLALLERAGRRGMKTFGVNRCGLDKPLSTSVFNQLALCAKKNQPTFTGTVYGIDKSMVGLGNVDNVSDINKPISTATQSALNLKSDATTTVSNFNTLNPAIALKTDSATLTSNISTLNTTIGLKAHSADVYTKSQNDLRLTNNTNSLNTAISSKADSTTLTSNIATLNTAIGLKANTSNI